MPMLCPQCRTPSFDSYSPEAGLEAIRCATCFGLFISSARYFAFVSTSPDQAVEQPPPPVVSDQREIKLCPACTKFMHYYAVGHGVSFGIDKCNTCGAVWLNAGEWEELRRRQIHRNLHTIASDIWQERVRREIRAAAERAGMLRRLGAEDLEKLEGISAWVQSHPHATEILAYLRRAVPPASRSGE